MNTNTRISDLINSQLPKFVRDDHETFIAFMEAYYEYLEQHIENLSEGKLVDRTKNLLNYINIDTSLDEFLEKYYNQFLSLIPNDTIADKNLIIKKAKDFYRAKGSEKALKFLLRILYNKEAEFYYPKRDILRASDGKWFIQISLRIENVYLDDNLTVDVNDLEKFKNKKIVGRISNSSAIVERIDRFYESGTLINELIITNIIGDFLNDEIIDVTSDEYDLNATIFGATINTITITHRGTNYLIGDRLIFESDSGSDANAIVSGVTSGNITSLIVLNGGAGFKTNNYLFFSGGGGTGANAQVSNVNTSELIHPNTYNVINSAISLESNTTLDNLTYTNLNTTNANSSIISGMSYFTYGPCGPITDILLNNRGSNYLSPPTVDTLSNTTIRSLGILGRMSIESSGEDYQIGDILTFSGSGYGANGKISNVDSNGSITQVNFTSNSDWVIGGYGYSMSELPSVDIISSNGTNGEIIVTTILGDGDSYLTTSSNIGSIQAITIINRGRNYLEEPTINLKTSGDGTAQAEATIITGVFTYPGRYISDDGHLSSYNFLQNRDYYQNFSYVVKIQEALADYKKTILDLIHPAGLKLFGEYQLIDNSLNIDSEAMISSD
ncbi:MAG: hypothetical protein WD512_16005, partial [Candidatus Paceibacterota bacterium]